MFVFVSGAPCLDLIGTLKWRRDELEEQLATTADLRTWCAASGLGVRVDADEVDLRRARSVREALYRTIVAVRAGRRPPRADVAALNDLAAAPGPRVTLSAAGAVRRAATVDQALAALVRDAYDLLAGPDLARVRDCANPRCTRLFLDTSRGGTRRWCGMTECGNTAKVAAFRARQRDSG